MTIFARNKVHHAKLSSSIIPLVYNMVQNKMTSDDNIMSILDCVDENLSEVESSDNDNETGDNQESDRKSGTTDSEQSDWQAAPVVSG
jgi:hypothetical protein